MLGGSTRTFKCLPHHSDEMPGLLLGLLIFLRSFTDFFCVISRLTLVQLKGCFIQQHAFVISEGHLAYTHSPVYLVPVATPDESESAHELISALLHMVADALQANELQKLVSSLGASKLELTVAGGGFFVCNLRRLNKVVDLKPNVAGLGVNLNAAIEALLPPEARPI